MAKGVRGSCRRGLAELGTQWETASRCSAATSHTGSENVAQGVCAAWRGVCGARLALADEPGLTPDLVPFC